jgi:hypothetical protein
LRAGTPLQVVNPVVGFDAVLVVDLGVALRVIDERFGYQTVDKFSRGDPLAG